MKQRSGWIFSIYGCGPDVVLDGKMSKISIHVGVDEFGRSFRMAHPRHEQDIMDPFTAFANSVFKDPGSREKFIRHENGQHQASMSSDPVIPAVNENMNGGDGTTLHFDESMNGGPLHLDESMNGGLLHLDESMNGSTLHLDENMYRAVDENPLFPQLADAAPVSNQEFSWNDIFPDGFEPEFEDNLLELGQLQKDGNFTHEDIESLLSQFNQEGSWPVDVADHGSAFMQPQTSTSQYQEQPAGSITESYNPYLARVGADNLYEQFLSQEQPAMTNGCEQMIPEPAALNESMTAVAYPSFIQPPTPTASAVPHSESAAIYPSFIQPPAPTASTVPHSESPKIQPPAPNLMLGVSHSPIILPSPVPTTSAGIVIPPSPTVTGVLSDSKSHNLNPESTESIAANSAETQEEGLKAKEKSRSKATNDDASLIVEGPRNRKSAASKDVVPLTEKYQTKTDIPSWVTTAKAYLDDNMSSEPWIKCIGAWMEFENKLNFGTSVSLRHVSESKSKTT